MNVSEVDHVVCLCPLHHLSAQQTPTRDSTHDSTHHRPRSSSQPMSQLNTSHRHSSTASRRRHSNTSIATSSFDFLSYSDVDAGQQEEFHFLLARVCFCLFFLCIYIVHPIVTVAVSLLKDLWIHTYPVPTHTHPPTHTPPPTHTHMHAQETGWRRLCCHKGFVVNLLFLFVMALGIVLGEVLFPLEGFRGSGRAISNDTMCERNLEGD